MSQSIPFENNQKLYTPMFFLCFIYNFLMGFIFSNNIFYPLYVENAGGGPNTIGQFMAIFFVAAIVGRPLVGMLLDRFGPKLVMVIGVLCMTLPCIGFYFMLDGTLPLLSWIIRFVQGFGWACHLSAYLTMAAGLAPPGRKNEAVSMYSLSGLAANPLGPFIGETLIEFYGLESFFVMLTILGGIALIIILNVQSVKEENNNPFLNFSGIAKICMAPQFALIFFMALCFAASYSSIASFLTPIAIHREITSFSLFFTGFGLSGIAIRLIGSHWGDRYGFVTVLIPAFALYGSGLVILHMSTTLPMVILAGSVCGIAHGLAFPLLTSISDSFAPVHLRGTAIALTTGMMDVGNAVTSFALGWVGDAFGYQYLFLIGSSAPFLAFFILQWIGGMQLAQTKNN